MKRPEAIAIAAALGVGSVVGWAGGRWMGAEAEDLRAWDATAISESAKGGGAAREGARGSVEEEIGSVLAEPSGSRRAMALNRLCAGLDAGAARRALQEHAPDGSPKMRELRSRLFCRWAELDPAAAAQFALAIKDPNDNGSTLSGVLDVWIAQDVDAAEKFVRELNASGKADLLYSFVRQLANHDPERALAFAGTVPAKRDAQLGHVVFYALAKRDPVAATARAEALPAGKLRESAIVAAVDAWLGTDAPAAMAWVMRRPETPVNFDQKLLDRAVQSWGLTDPAAAARFVQALPAGQRGEYLLSSPVGMWAERDAPAATRWANALPTGEEKKNALLAIASRWEDENPGLAAQLVTQIASGDELEQRLTMIGNAWAARDANGALAWAQQQTGPLREKILPAVLARLAEEKPDAASAQLAALAEPELRRAAIKQIGDNLARRAPLEAARWMLALPAADASDAALRAVVGAGVGRDPAALASFLNELEKHPRRETMVAAFVEAAGWDHPAEALAWAATLADAEKRKTMTRETVRRFAWYHSEGARAWVLGEKLEPAEQQALLEVVEKTTRRR